MNRHIKKLMVFVMIAAMLFACACSAGSDNSIVGRTVKKNRFIFDSFEFGVATKDQIVQTRKISANDILRQRDVGEHESSMSVLADNPFEDLDAHNIKYIEIRYHFYDDLLCAGSYVFYMNNKEDLIELFKEIVSQYRAVEMPYPTLYRFSLQYNEIINSDSISVGSHVSWGDENGEDRPTALRIEPSHLNESFYTLYVSVYCPHRLFIDQ